MRFPRLPQVSGRRFRPSFPVLLTGVLLFGSPAAQAQTSAVRAAEPPNRPELVPQIGHTNFVNAVAFSDRRFLRDRQNPLADSSNQLWAALLAHIFAFLTAFFWGATLLCALYLNAKRWIRTQKRGRIFQFVTGALNYMAVLVFACSLTLFLVYVP